MLAILLGCLFVIGHVTEARLTIGAFNIQRLTDDKVANTTILNQIVQILKRYDIVTVEEVIHPTAINVVLEELSRVSRQPFSMTMSEALGRSTYKEHLTIIYRSDRVTLRQSLKYSDRGDRFYREPFSALFHSVHSEVKDFAVMAVHIRPKEATKEMDALPIAFHYAARHFHVMSFIITGDFNADCRYLSAKRLHHSRLWRDSHFFFLPLAASTDTTVNDNTDCQYDRFVLTGKALRASVQSSSAQVYNFQQDLQLSNNEALAISDHFPIQMMIR